MENINYNHLYYFWIIAREGGVTQASRLLNLAQPTLSAQLKLFEDQLGGVLFERKARKLLLNDLGKIVFDYADGIFKKSDEMLHAIRNREVTQITTLNIGVQANLAKKNLHNFLKPLLQNTKYNIQLVSLNQSELITKLKNHELDLCIIDDPLVPDLREVQSYLIHRSPVIFVASPDNKALRRKFPASIATENVFLPGVNSELRKQIEDYFKRNSITPRLKGSIEDEELLRIIALSGAGVVAINRSAVSDLLKTKGLYIIGDTLDLWKNFYFLVMPRKDLPKGVSDLLDKFRS